MNLICKNSEPCLHPAGADTYFQEPVVILLQRQNATLTLSAKTFAWQKTNLLAASETFLQTGICSSYYISQLLCLKKCLVSRAGMVLSEAKRARLRAKQQFPRWGN